MRAVIDHHDFGPAGERGVEARADFSAPELKVTMTIPMADMCHFASPAVSKKYNRQ